MVKVPKTKNIPAITPDDWAAALLASTLTAVNDAPKSSLSERLSNHSVKLFIAPSLVSETFEARLPPPIITIERSSAPAAESCSA